MSFLKRGPKFNNKPMNYEGISFQSTVECARWIELKFQEKAGLVSGLRRQVCLRVLGADGKKVCNYFADFVYTRDGVEVIEDVKGLVLDTFKLKNELLKAQGVNVNIIKRKDISKWAVDTAVQYRETRGGFCG